MYEPDPTYVCSECGHQWCSPAWPDACENCGAHHSSLREFRDESEADEFSEAAYHDWLERRHGPVEMRHEAMSLFTPAPAQIPGQMSL